MLKTILKIAALAGMTMASPATQAQDEDPFALSSQGDTASGERVFMQCQACHNLTEEGRTKMGPTLAGLFGREAGSVEGYNYSRALAEADFEWTEQQLNEWLSNPRGFLPGNRMAFGGVRQEQRRYDLIAYLRQATDNAED